MTSESHWQNHRVQRESPPEMCGRVCITCGLLQNEVCCRRCGGNRTLPYES